MKNFKIISAVGAVVVVLVGLFAAFGSFYSVNDGERGIIKSMGKVVGVAEPGLGWKVPFIVEVPVVSVRAQSTRWEALASYTRDQQVATAAVSVNWRIDPSAVTEVYINYGGAEGLAQRALWSQVGKSLETVFGQYNAENAVIDRAGLGLKFEQAVREATAQFPIIIDQVNIEGIDLPTEYEQRINERMSAEVEVRKLEQNALQAKVQAQITVTQAEAAAAAQVAAAKAQAEATRLQGEADAAAIDAKGKALKDNPALVELTKAERWNGVLPTTMLPGDTIPFINAKPDGL